MPRILILITLAEKGGAQTYVASLLPALAPRFEVVVAAHGDGPLVAAARDAGVTFVPLRHVRRPLNPVRDLLGLLELVTLIRRVRPDIVHVNSSKAGVLGRVAALLTRVPITVFTVHGWAFKAYSGVASALYRLADGLMAAATTVTICVTETERAAGLAARTCRAGRTVVIANAVDVGAAERARHADPPQLVPSDRESDPDDPPRIVAADRERHTDPPPRIVTVGRLAFPKDPLTLVRALARVRASGHLFRASFVGDGPDAADVAAEIRAVGLESSVELCGARSDVGAVLARSDVFVLSSRSEGGPISILEAMAAGLPVVASDVGGVREQVADGATGLLVPPGDPDALAGALERLLADPDLRRRLGAVGLERARERFDLPRLRAEHLELYDRELARRGLPIP
jgi:glycosyltransferase involved in cell wall biosynthesis